MAKKICTYGILAALCIVLGYVEYLINFDFLAPGIKIGLANSVTLILVARRDLKGAVAVNGVRIILSALLFSSPSSLIYSLSGAAVSMAAVWLLSNFQKFSLIGLSVIGAALHNAAQLTVAFFIIGAGVLYYSPILLVAAVIGGIITGSLATIVIKRSDL